MLLRVNRPGLDLLEGLELRHRDKDHDGLLAPGAFHLDSKSLLGQGIVWNEEKKEKATCTPAGCEPRDEQIKEGRKPKVILNLKNSFFL